ncbi:hypothetical protein C823_007707 [Eubacterium plexicaudatum ASF492]|uniref:Uncharacterized protein n=1 Tax=Eubacterium plexicaudatum ASF492 TaxID=1235802 RepID=N2A9R7_9FIRM|nr:hypothetical protein C823_007707 [Eubacterium plexicaudatum ASF492]
MTREQVQELLATIQVAFPNFNPKDKKATTNLWLMMLSDYTYEQVSSSLKEYIQAIYNNIKLPTRKTSKSAGYDFLFLWMQFFVQKEKW